MITSKKKLEKSKTKIDNGGTTEDTKMIDKLTMEQEAKVEEYYQEWLAHGISTKPADREDAEAAITELYVMSGVKPPRFEWAVSPLDAKKRFGCKDPWLTGQMDSYWIAFYLYCRDVLGIKYEEKYSKILDLYAIIAKSCGWWYPYTKAVVVCERPVECHLENGVLHRDGGMAIRYSDGFGSWNLHGVLVSREIAETRAEDIDPHIILKEKNAEIRREIVRKIGIERVVLKLGGKLIDKMGEYELINLNLGDGRARPYLKMRNPSIQTWHLEGVPPEIKTIKEALIWRNQTAATPEVLT